MHASERDRKREIEKRNTGEKDLADSHALCMS